MLPPGSPLLLTCICSLGACCPGNISGRFQVSRHLIFLFSPGLLLQKSPLSKYGVAEQRSIAWWVVGELHLTATQTKETKYRKKPTSVGKGEGPAFPEVLSGPCLGLAACRARIRSWLPHRAASQDRVEVSSGCGAT